MKLFACYFSFLAIIMVAIQVQAQYSNVVVFTQAKEPFNLVINGIQQSPKPETNIRITGLNAPNYKVLVSFQNKSLKEISKTVYLQPETEVTFEVLQNKKGVWVMRMLNSIPVDEAPEPRQDVVVLAYTTTPRLSTTTVNQTITVVTGGITGGTSVSTSTTTTQTTVGGGAHDEVSGEVYSEGHGNHGDQGGHGNHGDPGPNGCHKPMSREAFDQASASISSKSFASSKLTIAKQVAATNCLLSSQVKQIMKLFDFESDRLEFAKYAYKFTWDPKNYFQLNDAFQFETSIDELNQFINGGR